MSFLALGTYTISCLGSERFHRLGDPEEFSVLNSAALQCALILQKSYDICHEAVSTRAIFQVCVIHHKLTQRVFLSIEEYMSISCFHKDKK